MADERSFDLILGPDAHGDSLLVDGDTIAGLGSAGSVDLGEARRLDCADAALSPGRVNAHTHVYSGLAPFGMPAPEPPPENFVQILERLWWRLDRALDADSLRASARYYAADALLAGTTTLIDHHESPDFIEGSLDVLADACQELGMRAVLCYGATERNGGREEAQRGLAECRRFIEENDRPLVRSLVGLHASFTVSDDTIREAGELCRELGVPMHVHMAEDGADVVDAKERGYPGPLERLLELDALPAGSIMAHGVFLDADQVRLAAEQDLWLVQNPRSNRGNEVGYPPALAQSDRVALGTDGFPARMDDEAEVLREEAAAHDDAPEAVERRLEAGWALAGERFDVELAPLAVGSAADVVAIRDGAVRQVVVAGRTVVEDGRLLTGDLVAIRAEAEREAQRLWRRMRDLA
jgi:cytosine/adenosine deaminase-related metal-dependent hydrolase